MNNKGQFAGFTLVELMITVLLAAIVVSYGVPAFRNLVLNNRQAAHMNNILTSMMLARSEALKRNLSVTVCKSADNRTCTTVGGWEQGWIVFDDPTNAGTVDAGENVIRAFQGFPNDATLRGSQNIRDFVTYAATGFVVQGREQMVYCDSRVRNFTNDKTYARVLIIGATGQTKAVAGDDIAIGPVNSCQTP